MYNQRTDPRLSFSLGLAALLLATGGSGVAASPKPSNSITNSTPARPLVSASVLGGTSRLTLVASAFQDLKSGPADRLFTIPRGDGQEFELALRRFTVTIPETRFISAGQNGQANIPAPDVVSYRGQIADQPGSHAFLSVSSGGSVNGYVTQANGERYFLATQSSNVAAGGEVIISRESASPGLFEDIVSCGVTQTHDLRLSSPPVVARGGNAGRSPRVLYVAIDADQKFYQLFNDETAAQTYVVQVIAAVSDIYIRDFDAKLVLTFSRVWPAGGEPFGAHDLAGFADYWFLNEDPTPYHLIHMLSGRRDTSYGGVAYVAGSCSGSAFGISAFLLGGFPTPVGIPNLNTWDVVVVAHEMGHNMGTFHTHDGYTPPIDECGSSSIWSRGEIMSYCHTLAGGLLNTELRFTSRVQEVVRGDLELNNCQFYDCNDNGINDSLDVSNTTSPDANFNQIPDECEDCNSNGTLDPADIALGAPDVNGNGIPDVCETDCDGNGRPDAYDISNFGAADVNLNFVPDSCEPDCDSDTIADFIEIANSAGTLDFDRNGELDACQDCNANAVSDWIDLLRPGNIFVTDLIDIVREMHAASGTAVTSYSAGTMLDPHDVTFGPDRKAYVASRGNHRIIRIDPETAAVTTFVAAGSGGLNGPSGLTFGPSGNLFVSSLLTNSVLEFNGATGAFIRIFAAAGSGGLATPYGIEFGPNGNLFVAGGNRVNEYDGSTGAFIRNFVAPDLGGLNDARGMAWLPDGRILVASRGSNQVLAYDANGLSLGQFNDQYPLSGLWGVRVGPNGNVFVVRVSGNVRIVEYDVSSGRYLRSFIRGDAQLNQPTGFAFRSESPVDCNSNEALDVCDIADGLEVDANANSIPDSCESACGVAQALAAAPDGINKNRYLTFDTTSAQSGLRAIRVTLADLPFPFESFEGQSRWVGPPQDRPDTLSTTFKAATLQCDPFYSDWSDVGVLAVFDDAIVPGGTYELRAISDSCDPQQQASYSPPLDVITVLRWGDVITPFSPPSPTVQPDFGDVSALVDKFRNAPNAPTMARADLYPSLPDQSLNFSDISMVVDAFRGLAYPFPGPTACP